jgi:hypothetical protein
MLFHNSLLTLLPFQHFFSKIIQPFECLVSLSSVSWLTYLLNGLALLLNILPKPLLFLLFLIDLRDLWSFKHLIFLVFKLLLLNSCVLMQPVKHTAFLESLSSRLLEWWHTLRLTH